MKNEVLISVVIPIYNAEKYLARAAESVLHQTDGNVELILVNDGSTDGSGALCDTFAQGSEHVRVVHKINGGISSARNAGIAAAHGEYLMFLDADDYLDPDTCNLVADVIRTHHPDMIDFGWKYVSRSGEITPNHHKIPKNMVLGKEVIRNDILPPLLNLRHDPEKFVFDFAWNKVVRRDIIDHNDIRFDEKRQTWEDRPFVVQYLKFCETYFSMEQWFYNYVDIPGSLSRKYSMDFFRIILENYRLYKNLYGQEFDFDTEYVNNYWCRAIENMIFRSLEQTENQELIRKLILDVLGNEMVVTWFYNRTPDKPYEKRTRDFVVTGAYEKALSEYVRQVKTARRRAKVEQISYRVKHRILKWMGKP